MAGQPAFKAPYSLSSDQQGLLMAALASNNPNMKDGFGSALANPSQISDQQLVQPFSFDGLDPTFFPAGQDGALNAFGTTLESPDGPYLDFLDSSNGDLDFDFEQDQVMEGITASELPDKRKSPDGEKEENENGSKRREGEDKTAKKPGRKPLTSEPTTKRKAQNRAAQRAFRERKEKHLKDLETKVVELEKVSESTNHENGLLRAQVQRLQIELREYRKRLSMNSTGLLGRSPPLGASSQLSSSTNGVNFSFDFPQFGTNSLPYGSRPTPNPSTSSSASPPVAAGSTAVRSSNGENASPGAPCTSPTRFGSASLPPTSQGNINRDVLNNLFSPWMLNGAGSSSSSLEFKRLSTEPQSAKGTEKESSQTRAFQFNGTSVSSASPSASSVSQYGPNSSCGTSPEPSHNSPNTGNRDGAADIQDAIGHTCSASPEGESSFCEKLNMACGTFQNPIPRAMRVSNAAPANAAGSPPEGVPIDNAFNTSFNTSKGLDLWVNQNGGKFDPVLFGDYRDSQVAIVGDGDFTGGFFNDAMPNFELGNPLTWSDLTTGTGFTPTLPKMNPMEQADALQAGLDDDEVVPGEDTSKMLSCHKIWLKLQSTEDFNNGKIDIDGLCSELRAKARCSESGVVVDQKDVDAALQRLPPRRSS
ncbi:PAP1-domain-containing protein [Trichodelitschia bisporula]|uniref:PAP1-domain-containing protein n=1 Tax=Trichodelitschia bisporula TaxID=703511 RepID=A0A6G1HM06_9PEZI|nr:PAP1-domain-containing protein [Trichodelitschia bisporula]